MTNRRVWQVVGSIALGLLLSSKPATAESFSMGEVDWYGAVFTVDLQSYSGDQYTFEYTADFSNFDAAAAGDHTDYIVGINFKPSEGNLVSYTGATTDADGSWTYGVDSNLSSAGFTASCAAKGAGNDFFCGALTAGADYTANPTTGLPPLIYTWDFTLKITGVTDPTSLALNAPLRALFTSGTTNSQGDYYTALMSQTTHGVPEPSTLLLLGVGAATAFRKRIFQASSY
jgi:hypothetical protein